ASTTNEVEIQLNDANRDQVVAGVSRAICRAAALYRAEFPGVTSGRGRGAARQSHTRSRHSVFEPVFLLLSACGTDGISIAADYGYWTVGLAIERVLYADSPAECRVLRKRFRTQMALVCSCPISTPVPQ